MAYTKGISRILIAFVGAVTGATVGAFLGGMAFRLQHATGPDRYLVFGPAPGITTLLGVFLIGLLGAVVGVIVGIGRLKKHTGAIVGLIFGVGAVMWQRHSVASSGMTPLDDTIIVSVELLGLPLIGIIVSTAIDRFYPKRIGPLRSQ